MEDAMKIEIYRGKDRRWYWRLRARNGCVVADGVQGYARQGNACNAARSVKRHMYYALVVML